MKSIYIDNYDGKKYQGYSIKEYIGKNVEGFALKYNDEVAVFHPEGKRFIACALDFLAEKYGVEKVATSWSSKPRGNNKKSNALYKLGGVKLIYIDRNPDALCEKLARVISIISEADKVKYTIEFDVEDNLYVESHMRYTYASLAEAEEFSSCREQAQRIDEEVDSTGLTGEERKALISVRVNQGEFRKKLISKFHRCQICGISDEHLLIASHIKPWAECGEGELEERLDINNGLLLCPNHDKLFDRGYISFDDAGKIIISKNISVTDIIKMAIADDIVIELTEKNKYFMRYHRKMHSL